MKVTKAKSERSPSNLVERVGRNRYGVRICRNVEQLDDGTFSFDSYRSTFSASTYAELLAQIIHTCYSLDDETNLINDFLAEGGTQKYRTYREFVAWAKAQAKSLFQEVS